MTDTLDECDNALTTDASKRATEWYEKGSKKKAKIEAAREGIAVEINGVVAVADKANQDSKFMVMEECPDEYELGQ